MWQWIANYNSFIFQGHNLNDVWCIDFGTPLKDRYTVELIRGAAMWTIWLERNQLCFTQHKCRSLEINRNANS